MDTKTRSLIDTFARNAIHLHGVTVVGSSVVAAEKPTINVHSRELLAVVEFVSYLGDLGCLKDMVLHSVAGNAWTKLHKIPKPVLTAFDDALKTYKYIKGKKSKDGTRYVVTPVGESLLRRTPAYTSAKASVATAKGNSKKWMQDVSKSMEESGSKGSLHRYFKIPEDETIPMQLLKDTLKKPGISEKTRKRIQLAITFKKYAKTKGRKAIAAAKPMVPPLNKWKLTSAGNGEPLKYVWAVKPGRNFIEMYAIGSEWRVVINHMDVVPGFEFLKAKTSIYGTALYVRREHGELYLSPAAYPFSSPEEALKALKSALANEAAEQAEA